MTDHLDLASITCEVNSNGLQAGTVQSEACRPEIHVELDNTTVSWVTLSFFEFNSFHGEQMWSKQTKLVSLP